jgi:hypothetical protein
MRFLASRSSSFSLAFSERRDWSSADESLEGAAAGVGALYEGSEIAMGSEAEAGAGAETGVAGEGALKDLETAGTAGAGAEEGAGAAEVGVDV